MKLKIVEKNSEKTTVRDVGIGQAFSLNGDVYLLVGRNVDGSIKAANLTDMINGIESGYLMIFIPQTVVEAVYEVSVRLEEI